MSQKQPCQNATGTVVLVTYKRDNWCHQNFMECEGDCRNCPNILWWELEMKRRENRGAFVLTTCTNLCVCGPATVGEGLCECGAHPDLAPLSGGRSCDGQPCVEGCPRVACK